MEILNNEEMLNIRGGALKLHAIAAIVGGVLVFVIGVVDGLVNPKKCN